MNNNLGRARSQARRRKQLKQSLDELKAKQKIEADELKAWHQETRTNLETELKETERELLAWHDAVMRDDPEATHIDLGYATIKRYESTVPTIHATGDNKALAALAAQDPALVLAIAPNKNAIKALIKDRTCEVGPGGVIVDSETKEVMPGVVAEFSQLHMIVTNKPRERDE